MDKNISQILAELYALEPKLKEHEAELITIVQQLLAAKPDTRFDKQFASRLRAELAGQDQTSPLNSFNFNFMQKFGYILGGAAIASVLLVPVLLTNLSKPGSGSLIIDVGVGTGTKITLLDEQAFGNLGPAEFGYPLEARTAGDVPAGLGFAGSSLTAASPVSADASVSSDQAMPEETKIRPQSGGGGTASTM